MNELIEMISSVGFPIAISIYLLYRETRVAETHKKETEGFVQSINNNTLALTRLCDKLGEDING